MPRTARVAPPGIVYHVLNRSVGRMHMFRKPADFEAFQRVMLETHDRVPIPIFAWCILSNHWHFVVAPRREGQLSDFFRRLAHTHAMRWRVSHGTVGYGHLYQGRFKSFPVQADEHLITVCRYVERNALTAGLVRRAENWRWGSLWTQLRGEQTMRSLLADWPVDRPRNWIELVNRPLTAKELERVRTSLARGRPFGDERWIERTAQRLNLRHTLRREGRPSKNEQAKAE